MSSFTGKARRSALQMSSCESLCQASGPLHKGQTRISSSLGSIGAPAGPGEAGEKKIVEISGKDGLDTQIPHARVGECGAFYGILLRHDDHFGARVLQILGLKGVMVGKRMGLGAYPEAL